MNLKSKLQSLSFPNFNLKIHPFYQDYYSGKNLIFFIASLGVGFISFFMTNGKMLNLNYLIKAPTLEGVIDSIDQYKFLIMFYIALFAFSPRRKLEEIKNGNRIIAKLVIHSTFWETIVFYIGLFSILGLIFKVILPTQVLSPANWQIGVVFFHYFAIQTPDGLNFSMLLSILIVNVVYAIFHMKQIVISKNSFIYRPIDWLYFSLALAASKSFFYNYLSYGMITAVLLLALLYFLELLIARLVSIIRS